MVTHATIITRYVLNLFQNNVKKHFKTQIGVEQIMFKSIYQCFWCVWFYVLAFLEIPMLRTLESRKKVQLLFANLIPRHGTCDRYQVHSGLNSRGNLKEIVMGPPFEAPKMRFLSTFRSDWSSKREIFRLVELNKFQSLIFSKWMARKIHGK